MKLITNLQDLCEALNLDPVQLNAGDKKFDFPLRVPLSFVNRMEKGNPKDPLLLQVLPQAAEFTNMSGYSRDPLGERMVNPTPGLLHKYNGRVLLVTVGACAINCRYCFRRNFPYEELPALNQWQSAIDYIAKDKTISEVILSGGDPLILKDKSLENLILPLSAIPHLKRLRLHSRIPVVMPERISKALLDVLTHSSMQTIMVIHCNHPNEINVEVIDTLKKMRARNMHLLNQSVLLKNINDKAEILIKLSEKLFNAGVLPYYLHLLDKVEGTAHFEVAETKARELITQMSSHLPGYLVPKLVREVPGMAFKKIIA